MRKGRRKAGKKGAAKGKTGLAGEDMEKGRRERRSGNKGYGWWERQTEAGTGGDRRARKRKTIKKQGWQGKT